MQTIVVQLKNKKAIATLQSLEQKQFIRILSESEIDSVALQGEPMSLNSYKNWIKNAEKDETVDLKEAENKWIARRKKLQQLIK
ncbi:MAG TPA: hypothetical protein VNW06_08475 [Cytophagaceae bacterium]|nr:hypothetical protein [Cytophagaceae bacterium]